MSLYQPIYTDAVKDVIGDDPVLDQFDIYYEASFYGTSQDDYVTGTILSVSSDKKSFLTGSRGRYFSKFYAESTPPLDSTYGSNGVKLNPYLSARAAPWSEKTSTTSYRTRQYFDSSERYYDSCLPDFQDCLTSTSTEIWALNPSQKLFSPYGNVVSGNVGCIFFNSYKSDRTSQGFTNDPVVNNEWTWSYPFENKYNPTRRLIKSDSALGLSKISLQGDFFILISDVEDWLEVTNLTRLNTPQKIDGFFPVLPGNLKNLPSSARNSLRSRFVPPADDFDILFQENRIPASYSAQFLDDVFGVSMLIPGDVDLATKNNHPWLPAGVTDPGAEYLTSSMTADDTIKFLFGFGDLNNMTYGYRTFSSSLGTTEYSESFNRTNPADSRNFLASDVPTYTSTYLTVDWSKSPIPPKDPNTWCYVYRDGVTANNFNYVSASAPPPVVGMYWGVTGSNGWALFSNTSTTYGGTMPAPSADLVTTSSCCVDITSSVPWSLSYNRGIAADSSAFFMSYFSGIPGYPSHELPFGPAQVVLPLDLMTGSGPTTRFDVLSEYNSATETVFDSDAGKNVNGTNLFPFPPGAWRLNFLFAHNNYNTTVGSPDIAAIKDLQIKTYGPDCFPPDTNGQKLGGNNYPEFRTKVCDPRYNPSLAILGANKYQVTSSAEIYKSFVFGVSPVIRGWKYGLFNGYPTHSKAVFRRDRFGQLRDMLEQRQYSKFVNVQSPPLDNDATAPMGLNTNINSQTRSSGEGFNDIGTSVVEVNFVKQRYKKNDKGIGYIYNEKVDPARTYSQNLSPEVTSSLPYFDGEAKLRQESDLRLITDATLTSLQFDPSGLTVT